MIITHYASFYKRKKDAMRAAKTEVKAPRIFVEEALDWKGVIGELVGAEDDPVLVAPDEGEAFPVPVGLDGPVELPLRLGKSTLKRCQIHCSPKKNKPALAGKSLPVYDVNNAVGNKNVGYDHLSVIDEDLSILDGNLEGLALKSFDHITIREVGAIQRRTRGHD